MRKERRKLLPAILVIVAVVGGLAWMVFRTPGPPEPVYQGKRLSQWLSLLWPGMPPLDPGATQAVRQIGTNGIPIYLRMLRERDSDFKLKLIGLTQKQRLIKINIVEAEQRNWEAFQAFTVLGASASNAVPALIQLYEEPTSDISRQFTVRALGGIGPAAKEAVPMLLSNAATVGGDIGARIYSIQALGLIHSDVESVLPVLIKCLDKNAEPNARIFAMRALFSLGSDAKPAVPALVNLLKNPDPWITNMAAQALKTIDPEAATKAGVK